MTNSYEDAFELGRKSYKIGQNFRDNPFKEGTRLYHKWNAGFKSIKVMNTLANKIGKGSNNDNGPD